MPEKHHQAEITKTRYPTPERPAWKELVKHIAEMDDTLLDKGIVGLLAENLYFSTCMEIESQTMEIRPFEVLKQVHGHSTGS